MLSHDYTDDTTLDDLYEQQRIESLPERLQQLALAHALDQFEAVPVYTDRFVPADEADNQSSTR